MNIEFRNLDISAPILKAIVKWVLIKQQEYSKRPIPQILAGKMW
jgi:hypothetical protein